MTIQIDYNNTDRTRAEIIDLDRSATTHGATITVRRHRYHEGVVLAARASYRENLEATRTQPTP